MSQEALLTLSFPTNTKGGHFSLAVNYLPGEADERICFYSDFEVLGCVFGLIACARAPSYLFPSSLLPSLSANGRARTT